MISAGILENSSNFGRSVAAMTDSNDNSILIVGAPKIDDGGPDHGAVYLLFLSDTGTVKSFTKISDTLGSFTGIYLLFILLT
jgi:hypothetical protein